MSLNDQSMQCCLEHDHELDLQIQVYIYTWTVHVKKLFNELLNGMPLGFERDTNWAGTRHVHASKRLCVWDAKGEHDI